jgi:hypothetical protein
MTLRNLALVAASGLLLASPVVASAATPTARAAKPNYSACKGMKGKAMKTCKADAKKAATK